MMIELDNLFEKATKPVEIEKEPFDLISEMTINALLSLSVASLCIGRVERIFEILDEEGKEEQLDFMRRFLEKFPELIGIYEIDGQKIVNKLKNYPDDAIQLVQQMYEMLGYNLVLLEEEDD